MSIQVPTATIITALAASAFSSLVTGIALEDTFELIPSRFAMYLALGLSAALLLSVLLRDTEPSPAVTTIEYLNQTKALHQLATVMIERQSNEIKHQSNEIESLKSELKDINRKLNFREELVENVFGFNPEEFFKNDIYTARALTLLKYGTRNKFRNCVLSLSHEAIVGDSDYDDYLKTINEDNVSKEIDFAVYIVKKMLS